MLMALEVVGSERVLEVGTGTGYNAALLAHRLGDDRVVTIDVDSALIATARANLAHAGRSPRVVCGEGADGYPPGAPYDRILATCAVTTVPAAWLAQTRPGGTVVVPHSTAFSGGVGLLRLTVRGDGSAVGGYVGDAKFMFLRAQQPALGSLRELAPHQDQGVPSTTRLDPMLVTDPVAEAMVGLQVPEVGWRRSDDPNPTGEFTFWLYDGHGSWAAVDVEPGEREHHVEQYGPRCLWDEVERAYHHWIEAGRPTRERLGVSIDPTGRQTIWLDTPDRLFGIPGNSAA